MVSGLGCDVGLYVGTRLACETIKLVVYGRSLGGKPVLGSAALMLSVWRDSAGAGGHRLSIVCVNFG